MTRRALVTPAVLAVAAAGVAAAPAGGRPAPRPPRVSVMIVGPHGVVLAPTRVRARATRLRASGHRCRVAAATGLAALAGARRAGGPALRVRSDNACSPGQLFVTKVGRFANLGANGWSYKVGHRAPAVGAGKRTGVRGGTRVLWFWCVLRPGGCQRSLDLSAPPTAAPGAGVRVKVSAYDDRGRGRPAKHVLVRLGSDRARTGAGGRATLTAPAARGAYRLTAVGSGVVPAYPERLRVR